MAVHYYSLILDCVQYVQDKLQGMQDSPVFQLNKRQSEYMAHELLKVSVSLQARGAHECIEHGYIQRTVLLHLHAIVKRAQMFVERSCCDDSNPWLAAAMTFGDTTEQVIAILLDLHQWILALDIFVIAAAGDSQESQFQLLETGEEGYQRLSKKHSKMQSAIRDAARQDQEELLEKIASLLEMEEQNRLDYLRGVYLKSRLVHAEGGLQNVQELKAYTISSALGSGARGMVMKVNWLGQDLALKILKESDRTEAIILAQVQHPNVVQLFHSCKGMAPDGPRSCIIMELMSRDLQKHIGNVLRKQSKLPVKLKKGVTGSMPFSLPVAIDTMLQVAQAMKELHEKKLTHRDLKTSNILVKPVNDGFLELHSEGYLEVKLADFGSAKAHANTSQTRDLTRNIGSTLYGAPEIFEKEITKRERNFLPMVDVWSFGMTCSEILSGEMPFATEPRSTLHSRIIKDGLRPGLPEDCPEYLQFCIRSCWELQPQKRLCFPDLCRMLRHAKLLSLGLMDAETILRIQETLFAYQNYAKFMKSINVNSLHAKEESKTVRLGFHVLWRNLFGVGGNMET